MSRNARPSWSWKDPIYTSEQVEQLVLDLIYAVIDNNPRHIKTTREALSIAARFFGRDDTKRIWEEGVVYTLEDIRECLEQVGKDAFDE